MYEDIRKNKIKTGIIVAIFTAIIGLAIYGICYLFDFQEYAIIISAIFAIIFFRVAPRAITLFNKSITDKSG